MCVGAAINAGIKIIYYGSKSPESGIQTKHNKNLLSEIAIIPLLEYESLFQKKLTSFFIDKRKTKYNFKNNDKNMTNFDLKKMITKYKKEKNIKN
jgi:tRNA(Arg) A34 adenosine deaminase TadA